MKHGELSIEQLFSALARAEERVAKARAAGAPPSYIAERESSLKALRTRIRAYHDREAGIADHLDPAKRAAMMPTERQR